VSPAATGPATRSRSADLLRLVQVRALADAGEPLAEVVPFLHADPDQSAAALVDVGRRLTATYASPPGVRLTTLIEQRLRPAGIDVTHQAPRARSGKYPAVGVARTAHTAGRAREGGGRELAP